MEAEIGSFVGAREVDGYSLRVVECRASLCIAEVSSANSKALLFGSMLFGRKPSLGLYDPFTDVFPEMTETYGERMVTLVIFQKR